MRVTVEIPGYTFVIDGKLQIVTTVIGGMYWTHRLTEFIALLKESLERSRQSDEAPDRRPTPEAIG